MQTDNINILVPQKYRSRAFNDNKKIAKVNVSFNYNNPDDVHIFFIAALHFSHKNIIWCDGLYEHIDKEVKDYVASLFIQEEVAA